MGPFSAKQHYHCVGDQLTDIYHCTGYSRSNILEACSTCFPHAGAPKMVGFFRFLPLQFLNFGIILLQFSYFEICHYNFSYIRILPFYTYFTCLGPLSDCIHVHIFRMDENTHAASLPDVWTPLIRFFNLQLRGRPPRRVPALPRRPLPRRIDAAATDDTGGGVSTVCLRVFFGGPLPAPPRRGRRGCRGRGRSCTRRSREGTAGR